MKTIPVRSIQTFSTKNLPGIYCHSPFIAVGIDIHGEVRLCPCAAWHPTTIGNIFKSNLNELLSSPVAVAIRKSIIDGTYIYCNEKKCSGLASQINNEVGLNTIETTPPNILPLFDDPHEFIMPYHIILAGDQTCNLSCPSCRTSVIKVTEKQKMFQEELGKKLIENLLPTPTDQHITLLVSTSGELFASPMLLKFVGGISKKDFPNFKLEIQTNGLLCEKNWHRLNELQSSVDSITVTVDAAAPSTYELLRRGGTWNEIIQALTFLSNKKTEINTKLHLRMVVQRANYLEMLDFYNLANTYNADRTEYVRISNWETRTSDEHLAEDVFDERNPEYLRAIDMLTEIKKLPNIWLAGGIP